MGQRRLVMQADFLVKAATGEGPRTFTVTNPLPDDVEIIRYAQQPSRYGAQSSSVLWVVLQSASWEGDELAAGQELPAIEFSVAYSGGGVPVPELTQELIDDRVVDMGKALTAELSPNPTDEPEGSEPEGDQPDGSDPGGDEPKEPEGAESAPPPEREPVAAQAGPRTARAARPRAVGKATS